MSLPKGDDVNNKAVFTPDPNDPDMMAAFKAMAVSFFLVRSSNISLIQL